jgi:hypothetical protein
VLCGNALDPTAFAALMVEERAAMVFTNPPYNVPIDGHASGLGTIHHRPFPMASGEMDRTEFTDFLGQAFRNLAAFSIDGALHYICMDWRYVEELLTAGRKPYGEPKSLPDYALSSAVKSWYKAGTYGCFCGFDRTNPRFSNSVSSRSVFARRCSRDTATLEAWITCVSTPRASSQ